MIFALSPVALLSSCLLSVCAALFAGPGQAYPQVAAGDVSAAIRTALESHADTVPLARADWEQLTAAYSARGFAPFWTDRSWHPSRDALDALALITHSSDDGLAPSDYRADVLQQHAQALATGTPPSPGDIAQFDLGLSASTLLYFRQLHEGRVDPRAIGFRMTVPPDNHDFAAIMTRAIAEHRISDTAATLRPALALYRGLRDILTRYRALAADPALQAPPASPTAIKPGTPYSGAAILRRFLVALADMPADSSPPEQPPIYDAALVEGVRHFQVRHGLQPDGVLGKATQAAVRVPLAWRVRQIELALERLRWLPHLDQRRLLAVNIPMFRLLVWDVIPPSGAPNFSTGVIVGRALNTQTPVFVEEMQYVIFRPYWNVPPSILRGEILPALRRNPDYLRRQDMEIVSGPGDDARPVALSAESLAQLEQGRLRVRQRPGPKNALGLVKFVFPNDSNVYMHGTPAPQLFSQARRDFSHGCIRVEDPIGLAEWVLQGEDDWTRDNIIAAMDDTRSRRVDLARPIQVILFYITAVVAPDDGTIRFAEDIYHHDARLDRALSAR